MSIKNRAFIFIQIFALILFFAYLKYNSNHTQIPKVLPSAKATLLEANVKPLEAAPESAPPSVQAPSPLPSQSGSPEINPSQANLPQKSLSSLPKLVIRLHSQKPSTAPAKAECFNPDCISNEEFLKKTAEAKKAKEIADALSYCKKGNLQQCGELAKNYIRTGTYGVKTLLTPEEQSQALQRCKAGDDVSCVFSAGIISENGDRAAARELLKTVCNHGAMNFCYILGGIEPTADKSDLAATCNATHGTTCATLLGAYEKDGNKSAANDLLVKGCKEWGNLEACFALGKHMEDRDLEDTKKKCSEIDTASCVQVIGKIRESDPETAKSMTQTLCQKGIKLACDSLKNFPTPMSVP